jgi:hypothetical protein
MGKERGWVEKEGRRAEEVEGGGAALAAILEDQV